LLHSNLGSGTIFPLGEQQWQGYTCIFYLYCVLWPYAPCLRGTEGGVGMRRLPGGERV